MANNSQTLYGSGTNSFADFSNQNSVAENLMEILRKKNFFRSYSIKDFIKKQNLATTLLENGITSADSIAVETTNDPVSEGSETTTYGKNDVNSYVKKSIDTDTDIGNSAEVENVKQGINKAANDQMIQNFFDVYMSPEGEYTDINLRLGKVSKTLVYDNDSIDKIASVDPCLHNIKNINGTENHRLGVYSASNFSSDIEIYFINNSGFSYDYSESNAAEKYTISSKVKPGKVSFKGNYSFDRFQNYLFPPYSQMNLLNRSYGQISKGLNKIKNEDFDMENKMVTRLNLPYREIAFKSINDNIIYLQWLTERVTGIVSTYLTDWDISLYIQEGLVTTDKLKPKYVTLLHRIREDAPVSIHNSLHAFPYGVIPAAVSKLEGNNQVTWVPNYYPYSRYWSQYPGWRGNYRLRTKTNNYSKYYIPKFYEIAYRERVSDGFGKSNITSLRKQLQFDDFQGAALSGYEDWILPYYKTIYSNAEEELSKVDIEQMSYSDKHIKNSAFVDNNLKNIFNTSFKGGDESNVGTTDTTTETDYENYTFDEVEEDEDDEGMTFADIFNSGKESMDSNMEMITGGESPFSASAVSSGAAGLLGTDPDTFDNARTIGIPQRNPTLFGGPHSVYSSPLTIYSWYEPDNPFMRDVPRMNSMDVYNNYSNYKKDYDLAYDFTLAKQDTPNTNKYDFCLNNKFCTSSYTFADDPKCAGPKNYEHSFNETMQHFFNPSKGKINYLLKNSDSTISQFDNGWCIGKIKTFERDPSDPGSLPDIHALFWRSAWNNWWRGWSKVMEDFRRLVALNTKFRFEAIDKYVLFLGTGKRGRGQESYKRLENYEIIRQLNDKVIALFAKDASGRITDIFGIKFKMKKLPHVSYPDENNRRKQYRSFWVLEADLENPVFQYSGLEKTPFNPNVNDNDILNYRLNGKDKKIQINCAIIPGDRLASKPGAKIASNPSYWTGEESNFSTVFEGLCGDYYATNIYMDNKDYNLNTKFSNYQFYGTGNWRGEYPPNEIQDSLRKALLYPTFYSSTQAPNKNSEMITDTLRYYRYDPIMSIKVFYNLLRRQLSYLEYFGKNYINNDETFNFKTFHNIIKNCKAGNPVISNRIMWLTDNDDLTTDPENSSRKIKKNKLFGYNRWISYARDLFENSYLRSAADIKKEYTKKVSTLTSEITSLSPIVLKNSIEDLSLNEINIFLKSIKNINEGILQTKNSNGIYNEDLITKFCLSYLNVLYEMRKYFINKRCNKQEGTLFMMRSLESAFPMITQGSNADSQKPDFSISGDTFFSSANTNVAFYSVKETIKSKADKKVSDAKNRIKTQVKDDHIDYVYVKVDYITEDEYNNSVEYYKEQCKSKELEVKPVLDVMKIKKKNGEVAYVKLPLDGRYRLESKELLINESNMIYNSSLDKNASDYKLKCLPICVIDKAIWSNLRWNDANVCDKEEFNRLYKMSGKGNYVFPHPDNIHIEFDIMVALDYEKLIQAVSVGLDEPQELLCASKEPTDFWKIKVITKLPRSSGYLTDVKLAPYGKNGMDETFTASILGGTTGICISPIVKEQANNGLLMSDAMKKARKISDTFRNAQDAKDIGKMSTYT